MTVIHISPEFFPCTKPVVKKRNFDLGNGNQRYISIQRDHSRTSNSTQTAKGHETQFEIKGSSS